ncbi:MAG: hypothetical protein WDZ63_08375 [Burkholderiales bacterium]
MKLRVECYSGHRLDEEPRALWLGSRRLEVNEVIDRWLDPRHRYFKVLTDDGQFILRQDHDTGEWELSASAPRAG